MKSYTVYVLYSKKFNKIYIGQTCDLENRLIEHNNGLSTYTKKFIPWEVIHTEIFSSRTKAILREKQLKSSRGRSYIWENIIGVKKY